MGEPMVARVAAFANEPVGCRITGTPICWRPSANGLHKNIRATPGRPRSKCLYYSEIMRFLSITAFSAGNGGSPFRPRGLKRRRGCQEAPIFIKGPCRGDPEAPRKSDAGFKLNINLKYITVNAASAESFMRRASGPCSHRLNSSTPRANPYVIVSTHVYKKSHWMADFHFPGIKN